MNTKPVLVILAAGMGSRYGGLKQMDPVGEGGESIIDFSLYDAKLAGFETAVCIIKEDMATDFEAMMNRGAARFMNLRYAYQGVEHVPSGTDIPPGRKKPWGTAHALLQARPLIDGPFAVINADDYYGKQAFASAYDFLLNAKDGAPADYCAIGYRIENTLTEHGHVARGLCAVDGDGYISDIQEIKKIQRIGKEICYDAGQEEWKPLAEGSPVSMNFFGFTPSFLEALEQRFPAALQHILDTDPEGGEFFMPVVAGDLVKEGRARIRMIPSHERWYGVTYRKDRDAVALAMSEKMNHGEYPNPLWG